MTPTRAATSSIVTAAKPRSANSDARRGERLALALGARQPRHAACSSAGRPPSASAGSGTPNPSTSRPASGPQLRAQRVDGLDHRLRARGGQPAVLLVPAALGLDARRARTGCTGGRGSARSAGSSQRSTASANASSTTTSTHARAAATTWSWQSTSTSNGVAAAVDPALQPPRDALQDVLLAPAQEAELLLAVEQLALPRPAASSPASPSRHGRGAGRPPARPAPCAPRCARRSCRSPGRRRTTRRRADRARRTRPGSRSAGSSPRAGAGPCCRPRTW